MFLFQRKADRQCQITNLDDLGMKTIAQWIYLRLPPADPGSSPKHTKDAFINIYLNCVVWERRK